MIRRPTGGPVADPIREMLDSRKEGVIFSCGDQKKAENTRYAAYMLKHRNGYSYKTTMRGTDLIVYKSEADPYELHGTVKVDFRGE